MTKKQRVYIIGGKRTPFCEWLSGKRGDGQRGGALKDFSAIDLGAFAAKKTLESLCDNIKPALIDQVVFGNAIQGGPDSLYGGRRVALEAGLPIKTPALTVNRICGSGLEVFRQAAFSILGDDANFVLAGGAENLSETPFVIRNLRQYLGTKAYLELKKRAGNLPTFKDLFDMLPDLRGMSFPLEDLFWTFLRDGYTGLSMAGTAEKLGKRYGITREEADAFALRSHLLVKNATEQGRFRDEIAAITPHLEYGVLETIYRDDHFVPTCSMDGLSKLNPAFVKDGLVTAGNASGVVDGAGFCLVASERTVKRYGLRPLGRIVSWSAIGVNPEIMGIGPIAARAALTKAGLKKSRIDLWEVNEAFACQYLAVEKELGLDRDKVNVNGGAIGLGHPFAASGVRMVLTLLLELRRRRKHYGVATACIGGGQGMAIVVEAL